MAGMHQTIRALAQEYSEACHEINRRLTRCEEFLRRGLRSEAIHFGEAKPNLLDMLKVLDFPERAEWDQAVVQYQLPAAPVFRLETATALDRAYTEVAPLEELLKRHRLLALERGPVGERLAITSPICVRFATSRPIRSTRAARSASDR